MFWAKLYFLLTILIIVIAAPSTYIEERKCGGSRKKALGWAFIVSGLLVVVGAIAIYLCLE